MRLLALLLLALTATTAVAGDALTIAVVPKGTTHEFWKAVHAGAVKAARESEAAGQPVKLIWRGGVREDDRTAQIDVVQGFIGQRVSGIVLAPLDSKALVAPINLASAAKIPVVIIDSALESKKPVGFVATDNRAAGRLAGERAVALLNGKGRVLVLRYAAGSASTTEREEGFLEALKAAKDISVVSSDQYAGATMATALAASETLLNRFAGQLDLVFTPNESSTAGMAKAIKARQQNAAVRHVGFDASARLVDGLKAGEIHGLVVQDPFTMGYLGVKNLLAHIAGNKIEAKIDTPAKLITTENMTEPEFAALLAPPLEEFLGK
jgi:ribose transport system substrate-binding protein